MKRRGSIWRLWAPIVALATIIMMAVPLAMLAVPVAARAAELFYMDHDTLTGRYVGAVGPLVISGTLVPGDYARLLAKISDNEDRFIAQNKIIVASEQGDVTESIKIANLIKALHSEVTVGPLTGKCVGACFLIYAAANQRATDGAGLIGLEGLAPAADFLRSNGVPDALLAKLSPQSGIYWLSDADEASLGTRSPAFTRYLKSQCRWDDVIEREVYAGSRPFADLNALLACRARVTRADARQVLNAARKEGSARDTLDRQTESGIVAAQ